MSFNVRLTYFFFFHCSKQIPLPVTPSWLEILDIAETDVRDVCRRILTMYTRPKALWSELEAKIDELRKIHKQQQQQQLAAEHEKSNPKSSHSTDGHRE